MEMLTQKQKILVIGGVIALALIFIFYYINSTKDVLDKDEFETAVEEKEEEPTSDNKESKIIIHITGAVKNEGIVEVLENARINDVIEKARRNNTWCGYTKC